MTLRQLYRERLGPFLFFTPCGLATLAIVGAPLLVVTAPISVPVIGWAIARDRRAARRAMR